MHHLHTLAQSISSFLHTIYECKSAEIQETAALNDEATQSAVAFNTPAHIGYANVQRMCLRVLTISCSHKLAANMI